MAELIDFTLFNKN